MAVDKVVIQVEGDAKPIEKTIVALERLGKVDAANAKQFETTNQNWAQQFKKRDKEYQAGQDNNAKATEKAGKEVDKTTDKIVNQGKSASFLKNQFASIGATIAGAFAVTQLISFGKEAVNLAAKGEGIRRAFAALNKADLLDNLRAATRNTVADIDLMAAAVKANNFKIPLEDLARYFKFAQQRARETGESVDYLVESIVLGIGRKSPLILDNLGISAVELRAKLKGIGTESATVGQISQAVGQIIDEELSKQGVLLDTTADKLARLSAGWKNMWEQLGIGLVGAYDAIAGTLGAGSEASDKFIKETIERNNLLYKNIVDINAALGNDFENATAKWAEKQNERRRKTESEADTVGELLERIKALQEEYKDVSTPEQYAAITAKIKTVQEQLEKIIGKTTDKIKEQKKELEKPTKIDDSLGGTLDVTDYEAKQKEIQDLMQAGKDKEAEIAAAALKDRLAMDEKLAEGEKNNQEEVTANLEEQAQRREEIMGELGNAINQLMRIGFQQIQNQEQQQTDFFLQNLQIKKDAGEISEEQYAKLRKSFLQQQAQDQHDLAVFTAAINGALAVINAITTGDPYTAAVRAAIAGAIAAAEIAVIASQPVPQFEKGGKIKGKRHREGGTIIEAEEGEFVINRKAAKSIGFDNLDALNRGIVPPKLLRQGLTEQRNKNFETTMLKVFGSADFDTYPIEKLLKKGIQNDRQMAEYLVRNLKGSQRKRGGLK